MTKLRNLYAVTLAAVMTLATMGVAQASTTPATHVIDNEAGTLSVNNVVVQSATFLDQTAFDDLQQALDEGSGQSVVAIVVDVGVYSLHTSLEIDENPIENALENALLHVNAQQTHRVSIDAGATANHVPRGAEETALNSPHLLGTNHAQTAAPMLS